MNTCPICQREMIPGPTVDEHHLIPKSRGNRDKRAYDKSNLVLIHKVCHSKIHHTFSEGELLATYHTIDELVNHPEMMKFIKWVSNKPPVFVAKNKDTKSRKRKRR